ncbi:MAG: hypothetical protein IJC81_01800 [Clostridia bacterium]|nr:hypothetical protein [Clostridia bacterium]
MNIPELKKMPRRLIYLCLAAIFVYTLSLLRAKDAISPLLAAEILHSILISTVLSLGGGLLLDLEIRHGENKK